MRLLDRLEMGAQAAAGLLAKTLLGDRIVLRRASALVAHRRPRDWVRDPRTGLLVPDARSYVDVDEPELVWNVKTNAGIDFLHVQGYSASPGASGLRFIALSNDALTENAASTTLSNEIAANGLARAAGTVAHTNGTTTTTVSNTFTCATAAQAAQKAALFTAASAGTMNHALAFTQRSLQVGDQLAVTFTITLS